MDDLDSLLAELGGGGAPPPQAQRAPQPSPAAQRAPAPRPPQNNNGMDELDMLMADLGKPAQYQAPPQQQPKQAKADDLDSLLNELGGAPPRQAASQYQPAPSSLPAAQRQTQSQYQPPAQQRAAAPASDDLDSLLNELGGGAPAAAPRPQSVSQPQTQSQYQSRPQQPVAQAKPADDLDSLLNELGGTGGAPVRSQPPQSQPQRAPSQIHSPAKGGDDLDSLLNELGGSSAPRAQAKPQQNSVYGRGPAPAPAAAPVSQGRPGASPAADDLDSLLNELGGPASRPQQQQQPPARAVSQSRPAAPPSGGDDLDSLLNELGSSAAPASQNRSTYSQPPAQRPAPAASKGGDDLDSLLNELGNSAGGAQVRPNQPSAASRGISQRPAPAAAGDDLESLLNELGGPASQPAPSQRSTLSGTRPITTGARGGAGGDEDLDLMLKGLSNQMMNVDDAAPAARGVCNYCRKPILGEVIQAMNKAFHPEHFICNNCQEPLGTRNFYEQEGHPHCENCFQSLFCARCAHCNKPVLDRCITAMGKKWHLDHFICGKCNAPFPDGMFYEKEGQPWCKNCYSCNFSYRCAACDQGIMGDVVNALGRHWHPEHFVCAFCQMPFEGGTFFAKEGRPYCRQHYNMQSGSACGGCGMPITGRVVEGLGRKWHPEHFVCAFCNTPLTGGGYQQHEGRPYCRNCSARMF